MSLNYDAGNLCLVFNKAWKTLARRWTSQKRSSFPFSWRLCMCRQKWTDWIFHSTTPTLRMLNLSSYKSQVVTSLESMMRTIRIICFNLAINYAWIAAPIVCFVVAVAMSIILCNRDKLVRWCYDQKEIEVTYDKFSWQA